MKKNQYVILGFGFWIATIVFCVTKSTHFAIFSAAMMLSCEICEAREQIIEEIKKP